MTSGDNTPNVIPGDLNSNNIRMIHREEIDAGGPMPPTRALPEEYISLIERWVQGGAPQTAEEAAALSPTTTQEAAPVEGTSAPDTTISPDLETAQPVGTLPPVTTLSP